MTRPDMRLQRSRLQGWLLGGFVWAHYPEVHRFCNSSGVPLKRGVRLPTETLDE